MHKNLVKLSRVVFELCEWTNRQTNQQKDTLIAILYTPPGGEVTTKRRRSVYWINSGRSYSRIIDNVYVQ